MLYSRKYLNLVLLMLLAAAIRLQAHDTLSFDTVETRSYRFYLDKDWDRLADFCDQAVHSGFDYYYLRIRGGIAFYEKAQYRKASSYFLKALEFNSGDPLANSYLYGSYLLSAQYEEAQNLSRNFDSAFAVEMQTEKTTPVSFVSLDGAARVSDHPDDFETGMAGQLTIGHYVMRRFSVMHAFNYYGQDEFRNQITQFQYYIRPVIPMKNRFVLSTGVHLIYEKLQRHLPPPPPGGPPSPEGPTDYLFGGLASVTLTRHSSYFDYSAGVTASLLDSISQFQAGLSLLYFPFANNRVSIGAYGYAHSEDTLKTVRYAFSPVLRAVIVPRLVLTASYFTNPQGNISEYTGLLVNNSQDATMSRYYINLQLGITKSFFLSAGYSYEQKFDIERIGRYHYNMFLFGIRYVPVR